MPRIMCAPALYRRLRGRPGVTPGPGVASGALGDWLARSFAFDGREVVIAVNTTTCLPIVFESAVPKRFHDEARAALGALLEDLGVSEEVVITETRALGSAVVAPLAKHMSGKLLNDLQYFCELELMYVTDLRRVQLNLAEFPHAPLPDGLVAREAVRWLLSARNTR